MNRFHVPIMLILCAIHGVAERADDRPNIVFVLLDDGRWDDLVAMGHPWVQAPHFDRVAKEGALFYNAITATPLCSLNRASILTGQYAHTHGIIDSVDRREQSHKLITCRET